MNRHFKTLLSTGTLLLLAACSNTGDDPTPGPDTGDTGDTGDVTPTPGASTVVINEVSSSGNDSIEFLNIGTEAVDLSGWSYTDDKLDLPTAFVFPAGTILQAGAYLVVNKDEHHTFGLGAEDGVTLLDTDLNVIDETAWGPGEAELSWCRIPNGTGDFQSCVQRTFGGVNTNDAPVCGNGILESPTEACDGALLNNTTCEDLGFGSGTLACAADCRSFDTSACGARSATVVINEVTSKDDDAIELHNFGTEAVDLSGWTVYDDNLARDDFYTFPAGTTIAAGGYLVLIGATDHQFGIGGADSVTLFDAEGTTIDTTTWQEGEAFVSWCRIPNASGPFQSCAQRTFGAANSDEAPPEPVCGDEAINGDEACDGALLDGTTCEDLGFGAGTLACAANCLTFDTSACGARSYTVVINEVTSQDDDAIELHNYGTEDVDLSGWSYTDDDLDRDRVILPEGTILAAGGYLVLTDHGFGIGQNDAVNLFDDSGALVDSTTWTVGHVTSWCRLPNGTGDFQVCSQRTFGAANVSE